MKKIAFGSFSRPNLAVQDTGKSFTVNIKIYFKSYN